MLQKLTRFALSFLLLATLLVGVSVATIAPAQAVATCAAGGVCAVGDTGPGGGTVFYASPSTFTCGPSLNLLCKYLEVAPNSWSGGSVDPTLPWSTFALAASDVPSIPNEADPTALQLVTSSAIGLGLKNSIAIVNQGNDTSTAAGAARNYGGGSQNDWYLPTNTELNQLCKWSHGNSWVSDATLCSGSFTSLGGFTDQRYMSSSEATATSAWRTNFHDSMAWKAIKNDNNTPLNVRPIRAFGDGTLSCAGGGTCVVGDLGPGGGRVFYVSPTTFTCGPTLNLTCKYLEAAPNTWAGGATDPTKIWADPAYQSADVPSIPNESSQNNTSVGIGLGLQNSINIVMQPNGISTAAGAARAYTGGSQGDWYLPTTAELNQMCKWERGVSWTSDATVCANGTPNSGLGAVGFISSAYWSSSEFDANSVWFQNFPDGAQRHTANSKSLSYGVRPVRAFASGPPPLTPRTLTIGIGSFTSTYTMTATPPTLTATASAGTGEITFTTSTAAVCGINSSSGVVSFVTAGTCTVSASIAADATYEAATSPSISFSTTRVDQATLTVNPASGTFGRTVTLASSGGSVSGAATFATSSTNCSISGTTLAVTHAVTCAVVATKAADATYNTISSASVEIAFDKGTPALTLVYPNTNSMTYSPSAKLTKISVSRSGDGVISYATPSTACSVDTVSGEITAVTAGVCSIVMSVAEGSDYNASTLTVGVSINKASQSTLSFTIDSSSKSYPYTKDVTFTSSGGSSTGAITYAISGGSAVGCSLVNSSDTNTVTATGAGTCLISATMAADENYLVAISGSQTFTFALAVLATPNTPTSVAVSTSTTSVAVSFDPVIGASSYTVKIYASDGTTQVGSDHTSFTSGSAVAGLAVATDYKAKVMAIGDGLRYSNSDLSELSGTVTTNAVGLVATFGTAISTPTGFTVKVTNYSVDYDFIATVGTGTVTTVVSGTDLLLTVTGLTPGTSATLTLTATRAGFATTTGTFSASSLTNKTVTFKSNFTGGAADTTQVANTSTNLTAAVLTRTSFTFEGWNTAADGSGTSYADGARYDFVTDLPLFAQWVQNSLHGINPSDLTLVGSITAAGIDSTFSGSTSGSAVAVTYTSGSLPTGTVINIYLLTNTSHAASLITSTSNFIVSFVVAWLALDGTVPPVNPDRPIRMSISNLLIKKGASVYSLIGNRAEVVGTATADGSVTISITDDPEIVVAIRKPDAPSGIPVASNGANAFSTITWNAPANNGGADITAYVVTSSGGQTCSPSSLATLSCNVTGLTNGTDYTFTVTATNSEGTSNASTATPVVRPLAPVVAPTPPPAPTPAPPSGGGGGGAYTAPTPDPAIAEKAAAEKAAAEAHAAAELKAAQDKAAAEKAAAEAHAAAELKAAQDKALAEAELAAAVKAAAEIIDAQAKTAAELKATNDKAAQDMRIADELRVAQEKADSDLRIAAEKKATEDVAAAALLAARKVTPTLTLYSISTSLKLSKYDTAYLKKYVSKLKPKAKVTCVGYIYTKNSSYVKAKALAEKQAKAVCAMIKAQRKTILTSVLLYPASKASKAAAGAKWVAVSYRVDGFRP